uniref:Photosystem II reaction center Psb28 protein n=1 Tax=Characiopsis acuta TaxID=2040456 RepID=A0A3R5QME7_9STRA|nr:photosystem II protein psb28 [Characiopsis acuta]QAA11325.1 photosystem II protein psb28 [Characiopsis acuta]
MLEFTSGINEPIVPNKIRFTSSQTDQTATLTVTFSDMSIFSSSNILSPRKNIIKALSLQGEYYKFSTKDIRVIWLKGKPYFLEAIFLMTSEKESMKLKKIFNAISKKII